MNNFLRAFMKRPPRTDNAALDAALRRTEMDAVRRDMVEAVRKSVDAGIPEGKTGDGEPVSGLHPIVISKAVLRKRGLIKNEDDFTKLSNVIEKTYPKDAVTGYYAKQCMPVIVGMAHMVGTAEGNTIPVSLIEGDFSNMGGCNKSHVGRAGTDKLINRICALVENSFTEYAKEKNLKISVQGVRAGGDEVRLVAYGLKQEQVREVLETRVHPRINLIAAEMGVHTAPHEKKGRIPGFGAAFATVDLTKRFDTSMLRDRLDAEIQDQKRIDGLLRMGMIDKEGVQRYMKDVYEPYLREQRVNGKPLDEQTIRTRMLNERGDMESMAGQLAAKWKRMTSGGTFYPPEYIKGRGKNPRDFFDALAKENASSVQQKLDAIQINESAVHVPFVSETVPDLGEAPESLRLRKVLKALGFKDIAQADKALFEWSEKERRYELNRKTLHNQKERTDVLRVAIDLMQQFDALEPAARCKATNLLLEDTVAYMQRHSLQGGMKAVHFELGNINGLNAVHYDLADAVLRETGRYIQDGLRAHDHGLGTNIMDHVYHEGGGKFKVLLPPDYPDKDLAAVTAYVDAQLQTHIRTKPVADFASQTYANESDGRRQEAIEKIGQLHSRLAQIERKSGKQIALVGDIPHPKDSSKSLTFRHDSITVAPDGSIKDSKGIPVEVPTGNTGVFDRKKAAQVLEILTDKAEIGFKAAQHNARV